MSLWAGSHQRNQDHPRQLRSGRAERKAAKTEVGSGAPIGSAPTLPPPLLSEQPVPSTSVSYRPPRFPTGVIQGDQRPPVSAGGYA